MDFFQKVNEKVMKKRLEKEEELVLKAQEAEERKREKEEARARKLEREANGGGAGDDQEYQLEPKVIEALRGVRVVAIAAGSRHSMVLTDEGEVLSFGSNGGEEIGSVGMPVPCGVLGNDALFSMTPRPIPGLRVASA